MQRKPVVLTAAFVLAVSLLTASRAPASGAPADAPARSVDAVGTSFTYQGRLTDGGLPAGGAYDFQFMLFDASSGGAQVGSPLTRNDVAVTDGLFTVGLDFGSAAFTGNPRYLEIGVRPGASTGAYTTLAPRQPLTPSPYAMYTTNADQLDGVHAAGFLSSSGGTLNGDLDVTGHLTAVYGGGVARGGSPYTNRFFAGNLPYNSVNASYKLLVMVWGGTWENTTLGQDFYAISSRGGLKVSRTRLFGGTSKYALKIYDNGSSYDVVIEVVSQSFPNLVIRSMKLAGTAGFAEQVVTGSYSITGKTDVTPTIENHIVVDNAGNVGIGTASPAAKLEVNGTARTDVLQIMGGSDLAEPFDIAGVEEVSPGMVVAIDPEHPGQLRIADTAYDRAVAGCVSGANGIQPGLVMQQDGTPADGAHPVALSGRVYCRADASYGAIRPGDLLTTSDTPGHLRRVGDYDRARGAVVGKAMSGLASGSGLVLVLVTLQ